MRAAKATYGGLTAREREVAHQVALGKSNGEIATALIVTKRTVETHLNNILYKLNLTSRAQLVVWAIEKGLASSAGEAGTSTDLARSESSAPFHDLRALCHLLHARRLITSVRATMKGAFSFIILVSRLQIGRGAALLNEPTNSARHKERRDD